MSAQPIQFLNRRTGRIETEQVFGEGWLRFAYGNPVGRLSVWLLARRAVFSQWFGRRMSKPASALRILPFITQYNLDVEEFAKSPFDYKTFNEFFYRALRQEARPITPGDEIAVFPADGRHLGFANVDTAEGFYVKGAKFTFAELFGSAEAARPFAGGSMLISRLCPVDYHRFHFPIAGNAGEPRHIGGWLYSVSPIALRRRLRYLVENKRVITLIESPRFGRVAMIEVGATNVEFRWNVNIDSDPAMPRFETFYPGNSWVDSVSLDGYNWGTTQSWSSWLSFRDTFHAPLNRLLRLSTRPVHIDETGCPQDGGGDKAAWVRAMFEYVAGRPEVLTVTWFDFSSCGSTSAAGLSMKSTSPFSSAEAAVCGSGMILKISLSTFAWRPPAMPSGASARGT